MVASNNVFFLAVESEYQIPGIYLEYVDRGMAVVGLSTDGLASSEFCPRGHLLSTSMLVDARECGT